jgi:peptide-methionine (R)-S-oxide reductase
MNKNSYPVQKSEAEWLEELGEEKYAILRKKGTERPFTGDYNLHFEKGNYHCAGCNALLFESNTKFESGCGWPSFDDSVEGSVEYVKDTSYGMMRVEILCASCGGHLGHIFNDGPTPTGQRYCVNSLSIEFNKEET